MQSEGRGFCNGCQAIERSRGLRIADLLYTELESREKFKKSVIVKTNALHHRKVPSWRGWFDLTHQQLFGLNESTVLSFSERTGGNHVFHVIHLSILHTYVYNDREMIKTIS